MTVFLRPAGSFPWLGARAPPNYNLPHVTSHQCHPARLPSKERFPCPTVLPAMLGRRPMLLPEQYAWFEPVLVATIVVFVINLIGNTIGFGSRIGGALMSAILFAIVFGGLAYFGYGSVSMSLTTTPSASAPAQAKK
jgi:hypothetical protein